LTKVDGYTQADFITMVAEEAGFTKSDTKILLKAMEKVFQDIVKERQSLTLPGLFRIFVRQGNAHRRYDPVHSKYIEKEAYEKVVIHASKELTHIIEEEPE
jgi:nucleoid DNA-binding protein